MCKDLEHSTCSSCSLALKNLEHCTILYARQVFTAAAACGWIHHMQVDILIPRQLFIFIFLK